MVILGICSTGNTVSVLNDNNVVTSYNLLSLKAVSSFSGNIISLS
jgi:hypothetical protein